MKKHKFELISIVINIDINKYCIKFLNYIKQMEMEPLSSYVLCFKNKNNTNTNETKKKINTFINKYIDANGYILIEDELIINLQELIYVVATNITINKNIDKTVLLSLIKSSDEYLKIFLKGEKILYKTFFEKLCINISSLFITHLYYEYIAKLIFQIYLYGTTIDNFETYLVYNENLYYDNPYHVKLLSDYIDNNIDCFDDNEMTITSYKILLLGHLGNKKFKESDKIIIENLNTVYARVTLELVKNTPMSNDNIIAVYEDIRQHYYAPSTPIFYNSLNKKHNLLSSCFLINVEDSIESMGNLSKKVLNIQKHNSGVGIMLNKIRAETRDVMNGITESKGVFDYIDMFALYSDKFKNKKRQRSSNTNVILSLDHPDIIKFLKLKVSTNRKENDHYNNLFTTISIPDEFIFRYLTKKPWYFISPEQTLDGKTHLYDVYGDDYSNLYNEMISNEKIEKKQIDSYVLMSEIVNSLIQTGTPFIFFKDIINYTSNQKNHGIIQGTNLCTEIFQYCDENETACCNLMSLNLKKFVKKDAAGFKYFDFKLFQKKISSVVILLNNTIDNGLYSDETCKASNLKTRPLGIGIQGLCNAFYELGLSYLQGKNLYRQIAEVMYYTVLLTSNNLAKNNSFKLYNPDIPSPLHLGLFSFDLYQTYQNNKINKLKTNNLNYLCENINTDDYKSLYISQNKWSLLTESIKKYSITNSLGIAYMPTSLSSGIYDNVESFEPMTYNINKRMFSEYDFIFRNEYLVDDLLKLGLYDYTNVIHELMNVNGDVSKLKIPNKYKELLQSKYQTIYEIKEDEYVKFNTYVNPFIDQGKSTNLYVKNNDQKQITKSIIDHWLYGSKSLYYYRTETIVEPLIFTDLEKSIENIINDKPENNINNNLVCTKNSDCNTCLS